MQKLNTHKAALSLGSFIAFVHLIWVILVATGSAKPFLDFVLGLHHISVPFSITPFSFGPALMLLIVTFVVGYIAGWVFSTIWNSVQKR